MRGGQREGAKVRRCDPAGHDAVAVVGRASLDRPERPCRAVLQPADREEGSNTTVIRIGVEHFATNGHGGDLSLRLHQRSVSNEDNGRGAVKRGNGGAS